MLKFFVASHRTLAIQTCQFHICALCKIAMGCIWACSTCIIDRLNRVELVGIKSSEAIYAENQCFFFFFFFQQPFNSGGRVLESCSGWIAFYSLAAYRPLSAAAVIMNLGFFLSLGEVHNCSVKIFQALLVLCNYLCLRVAYIETLGTHVLCFCGTCSKFVWRQGGLHCLKSRRRKRKKMQHQREPSSSNASHSTCSHF